MITPLNLDVEGFIVSLGAQNAQEWAGFTQDLRNDKKGLADMTSKPQKEFMKAGVILALGIVIIIAIVVLPTSVPSLSHLGGSAGNKTGGGLGFLTSLTGHLIFGSNTILSIVSWFL